MAKSLSLWDTMLALDVARLSPISEIWVIFDIHIRKIRKSQQNHGKIPKIMVIAGQLPITQQWLKNIENPGTLTP